MIVLFIATENNCMIVILIISEKSYVDNLGEELNVLDDLGIF
jgi:hypothetical protein